jgi:hypothetical protein
LAGINCNAYLYLDGMMTPIAWLIEGYDGIGSYIKTVVSSKPKPDSWISITPLYIAPKELSDEQVIEILKKASKK